MRTSKMVIGLALAVLGLQLGTAAAEERDLPIGMAQAKNLVKRTVTIDDQTFRVTEATRIEDRAGRAMRLEQVQTVADQGALVEIDRVTYAYDAHDDVLALLKSVPAPR